MKPNDITPPLPPFADGDARSTIDADQLEAIVGRALHSAAGKTQTVACHLFEQQQADAAYEQEQRQISEHHARASAFLARARTDGIASAAKVGTGTLIGFLLGGPPGAILGGGAAWLIDKFTDPDGR